jgi:hypothetical protein
MSKFDRRIENGVLRPKDLRRRLSEEPSEGVFEFEREFWGTRLPSPKVEVVYKACEDVSDFKRDCIEIGAVGVNGYANLFKKIGKKISGSDLLKTMIAERFSLFSSFKVKHANWECDFCLREIGEQTKEDFERFVSVRTQLSSIGEIGGRVLERRLGTYDPIRMREAYEKLYSNIEEKTKPNAKKDFQNSVKAFRKATQSRPTSKAVLRNLRSRDEEQQRAYLDSCFSHALSGTALLYTADAVETEYRGSFPRLIVKNLGIVPSYVSYFHRFNKNYMPNFAENLSAELSKLKDS